VYCSLVSYQVDLNFVDVLRQPFTFLLHDLFNAIQNFQLLGLQLQNVPKLKRLDYLALIFIAIVAIKTASHAHLSGFNLGSARPST